MNKKTTDVVAYITLIGWAVAYFAGTKEQSKYHLNQALVIGALSVITGFLQRLFGKLFLIGAAIDLVSLLVFACWAVGVYSAITDKEIAIPFVSDIKLL